MTKQVAVNFSRKNVYFKLILTIDLDDLVDKNCNCSLCDTSKKYVLFTEAKSVNLVHNYY